MIRVVDDAGRALALPHAARRIVSLVPSLTETVFALGGGESVVGVTRYCTEPAAAVAHIARVGGTKNPDIDRIVALRPDLVIVNAEENRREDFAALEVAGLMVFVSFPRRARDVALLLHRLGALSATEPAAAAMVSELERTLALMDATAPPHRARIFCPIWKNPWMSFNRDTYDDDMLWIAGAENVCRDREARYPSVTLADIAAAQPEVILLPDEPYVFQEKDLPALAALRDTPAWRERRVHFVDGKALSWYGARTAAALGVLRRIIAALRDPHPGPPP